MWSCISSTWREDEARQKSKLRVVFRKDCKEHTQVQDHEVDRKNPAMHFVFEIFIICLFLCGGPPHLHLCCMSSTSGPTLLEPRSLPQRSIIWSPRTCFQVETISRWFLPVLDFVESNIVVPDSPRISDEGWDELRTFLRFRNSRRLLRRVLRISTLRQKFQEERPRCSNSRWHVLPP